MSEASNSIQKRVEKIATQPESINGSLKTLPMIRSLDLRENFDESTFNFDKKPMITAVLGQARGRTAYSSCATCASGNTAFSSCIVVPGHLSGACCNCFYKGLGHKCSFRKGEW